jgi:CheY-like chemotaxis protein
MKNQPIQIPYILWAEDDADDLMFIQDSFECMASKYKIMEARNGQDILDFLDSINDPSLFPNIIVLDMNMPVLNGRDTLAILKKVDKYSMIPVVFFTTSSRDRDLSFCKLYGVEMFTKPSNFQDYPKIIQMMLSSLSGSLEKGVSPVELSL